MFKPEWIPREMNDQADYLSRIVDFDDWGIAQSSFDEISREWGSLRHRFICL